MARRQPWRAAVVCPHTRDAQDRPSHTQYTFQQLDQASDQLARGLQRLGLRRGARAALMAPPGLDFFALAFGLFKLGAVPVLIDPGAGLRNLRLGFNEAAPEAFIGVPKAHAARILLGWARRSCTLKINIGSRAWPGARSLREVRLLGAGPEPFEPAAPAPGETAAILFTSGSTGPSKGVVYTHEFFNAQIDLIRQLYGIQPGETDLPTFPLFALFGPALGMTAIIPDMDPTRPAQVNPERIIEAIELFGVTNLFGSPAVINRVGRYGEANGVRLPTLRRAISAGAPVPARALERFASMLGPDAQVFTPYGATECLPVSSIGSREILGETRRDTEAGRGVCVGLPVPGLIVRVIRITDEPIATWSADLELPDGQTGELVVQGTHVTSLYHNRPQATALAKIPDPATGGFYHRMGDVGWRDARGRLWFCGRKAHRVVTPEGVFFTIPCEAVFNTHPSLFRSALVGVRRNGRVEPVLCVELEPAERSRDPARLSEELAAIGARYPHARPVKTFLVHPAFPVDIRHNSKIFREKLAVWAARRLGAA